VQTGTANVGAAFGLIFRGFAQLFKLAATNVL
jgi:hypothetical protein